MSSVKEHILNFRKKRVKIISRNKGLLPLIDGPKIILHIIPMSAFAIGEEVDLLSIKALCESSDKRKWFTPFGVNTFNGYEVTLEGFVTYPNQSQENHGAYSLFSRNGVIEAVSTLSVSDHAINARKYEQYLLEQEYLKILNELNFNPPIYLFVSLVDVNTFNINLIYKSGNDTVTENSPRSFSQNIIELRETVVESYSTLNVKLFKSAFDRICNACGLIKCLHYNDENEYDFLG